MLKKTGYSRIIPQVLFVVFFGMSFIFATEPPRHPKISKWLVGNNAWINPDDAKWKIAADCPLQSVRIGGIEYNGYMPKEADSWIGKIKAMGAQPVVQIPSGWSGQQAADFVKSHMDNIYYNIGNEPALFGGNVGGISSYIKRIAPAMKEANPQIKIFVPDECDFWDYYKELFSATASVGGNDVSGKTPDGKYWMVDGLSWHRYADGDITNDVGQRVKAAWELADAVNKAKGRTGDDQLSCGIGEFNHNGGGGVITFINGQAFGCIYGLCMKYLYTYATMWSMAESDGQGGGTDFGWIQAGNKPRAMYYHMQMISQNFSGIYCEGTCDQKSVFTYGCRDSNKVCAMIINKGNSSQSYTLRFNNDPVSTGGCKINIDADTSLEYKDEIPGNATQCIVIKCSGSKKILYTAANFSAWAPSTTTSITAKFCDQAGILNIHQSAAPKPGISITPRMNGIAIHFPSSQQYRAEIISLDGKTLREETGTSADAFLRTQGLATGVYAVSIIGKGIKINKTWYVGTMQ
jgi:hypothetical protein